MKLGLHLGYWGARPTDRYVELAQRAEQLGFDIVCTAEAYGSDVFTPLTAVAVQTERIRIGTSIMQISARTPACAAMTALTLDHVSEGRLCLGIGVSGPQVVEGWYGQPFRKPLERTREWVALFRAILARDGPVTFEGAQYQLPYRGPNSLGQGKALMSITRPRRNHIPLFLGAEGPKNVELAARELDGWFAMLLPPERFDLFADALALAKADFEVMQTLPIHLQVRHERGFLAVKEHIALYVGGMGSQQENFHKRVVERCGYAAAAQRIQDLWIAGDRVGAVEAVPDELADAMSLVGTREHIREKIKLWKRSPVTTLMVWRAETFEETVSNMQLLAEEVL
jgi:F420-dependent oxidoreductase-like protein